MINIEASCYGKKFGHNYAGGYCLFCGESQTGVALPKKMSNVSDLLRHIERRKNNYTSEMQAFIDEVRTTFGDTAKGGIGSFPFYGALIKKVGLPFATQKFYEAKSSGTNARSPKRLYIWMLKQEIARINASKLKTIEA